MKSSLGREEIALVDACRLRCWIRFLELVSDDLTRILSEQLPNFQTLPVNFCTRSSFKRTDHVVNIDLYYTSLLIKFGNLEEVFWTKKSSEASSSRKGMRRTASDRKGNSLKYFKDFYLKAKARILP